MNGKEKKEKLTCRSSSRNRNGKINDNDGFKFIPSTADDEVDKTRGKSQSSNKESEKENSCSFIYEVFDGESTCLKLSGQTGIQAVENKSGFNHECCDKKNRNASGITPSKLSPQEAHAKKAVRKAKLSLRRKASKAALLNAFKTGFLRTSNESLLNTTDDFQDDKQSSYFTTCNVLSEGNLAKRKKIKGQENCAVEEKNIENASANEPVSPQKKQRSGNISKNDLQTVVCENNEDVLKKCPSCCEAIVGEEYNQHVVRCLKEKFTKDSNVIDQENLACYLQKRENQKVEEDVLTEEKFSFCQICQKDFSHWNSRRRQQHVNKCMDKVEAERQHKMEEEKAIERARNAILPCPMCGKIFKKQAVSCNFTQIISSRP